VTTSEVRMSTEETGSKRTWPSGTTLVAALAAGLVGGALVAGAVALFSDNGDSGSSTSSTTSSCDVVSVSDRVLPSVVTLQVSGQRGSGTGSGVVVRAPLPGEAPGGSPAAGTYILTNEHVIAPGGSVGEVHITYADGTTHAGKVVGADPVTDLAVVRDEEGQNDASPVAVGESGGLRVGQGVVALGAPLGLSSTVTSGIVSATDRYVRVPSSAGSTHHLVGAIQTDASINPGNSGGALVNCSGELVGINSAGASPPGDQGSVGLNFAIPSTLFAPLGNELIATGRVRHPTLGLQVATISEEAAQANGVSPGLFVQQVVPGGPAAAAGLQPGDIVTSIDGHAMRSADDLTQLELGLDVGQKVEVTYERGGQSSTTEVTAASAG
jgi:putative serine protease PepD